MKKICLLTCLTLTMALTTGAAMADSIKGKVGVTGRLGFIVPTDGVYVSGNTLHDYDADPDFIFGGGLIYGIDQNWAAEIDVTRAEFDVDIPNEGRKGEIINVSLGGQYRFMPQEKLVPYLGAGLDILINDLKGHSVDTTVGVHGAGGVDYFILKPLALTAEAKIVAGPEADINRNGTRVGRFSTTNFTTTAGIRFFFN
ncbi:MAG: hypothetical protein CXR31_13410 [Geobacter sp.]|nr:MAG: hypothetical protein CXR31_13410 [Geobacter sp.]